MNPVTHPLNTRLNGLIAQMREMKLTPEELEKTVSKYADAQTTSHLLIHTAATMLLLEIIFGKGTPT